MQVFHGIVQSHLNYTGLVGSNPRVALRTPTNAFLASGGLSINTY